MTRQRCGYVTKLCWTLLCLTSLAAVSEAKVFSSRQEAVKNAFPEADNVQTRTVILTDEQRQQIERLATVPFDSKIITLYTAYQGTDIIGYSVIETRVIRTLPGSFLVALSPTGEVKTVMAVAFHEPEEYLPTERWLRQFDHKSLRPELQVQKDIRGIAGATLSSQAVTNAVRSVLAFFQVVVREEK